MRFPIASQQEVRRIRGNLAEAGGHCRKSGMDAGRRAEAARSGACARETESKSGSVVSPTRKSSETGHKIRWPVPPECANCSGF